MARWKLCLVVLIVVSLSGIVGCRKEKEEPKRKAPPEKRVEARPRHPCEKAMIGFLDALAVSDYRGAAEFLDVEEMLAKREEGRAPAAGPPDAEEMKEALARMMETAGRNQKGKLTYEILASHVSGGTAKVEVVVFRDDTVADRWMYDLTRRGQQWKLSASAVRAIAGPTMGRPPERPSQ